MTPGRLHQEDGATAVLMLLSIFVLFGAAMIAIDAGSLWTSRRNLIIGTDAAAHAAAVGHAEKHSCSTAGPRSDAETYLATNTSASTMVAYDVDCTGSGGRVRVDARQPATLFFAPLFGRDSAHVAASSTAEWGSLTASIGARPIVICLFDDHVQEWIGSSSGTSAAYTSLRGTDDPETPYHDHPEYAGAGVVHHIPFTKDMDPRCGDPPGSWGWLDFDGNAGDNGASALKDRIDNGYLGLVDLGESLSGDEDCNDKSPGLDDCSGKSGANASTDAAVDATMVCPAGVATSDCPSFVILVHDDAYKSGGETLYNPAAFVGIVVRGANKVNAKDGWFELEFVRFVAQGHVGPHTNGGVPGPLGVELCATEYAGTDDDHCDY